MALGRLAVMGHRWVVALLVLGGCAGIVPGGTPHDATAVFRPASMIADRETVAPGEVVELSFPDGHERGLMFVLEEESGATWVYRYMLLSDATGGRPAWYRPDQEGVAVEDVGVAGPGPDRVVVPDVAAAGSWRICTGNAAENVCVRIAIVAP